MNRPDWNLARFPPMIWYETESPILAGGNAMAHSPKPEHTTDALPPDPYPDYSPVWVFFFQSWLIMCLAVVCIALVFYLYSYIR
jgi:hypothetical protein